MKQLFVSIAAILLAISAWAVPARPGAFDYIQPDGSVVRLELHGDEFFSWATLAGTNQVVELDANGFWRNGSIDPAARKAAIAFRDEVNRQRASISPRTHTDNKMTHGTRHIPVFLVEFQDKSFTLNNPGDQFDALLNQHGYSANGGTGSVQDYYMDNSHGQFQPIFDVYGPVLLPEKMAYYGGNQGSRHNLHPEIAAFQAAQMLDSSVDFSQYDHNNDGYVDMLLFYYAGYNEAEGGPADSLWPHQWSVQSSSSSEAKNTLFDGLRLATYFCTSELRGNQGVNMCGIGTTCHEFGHSLGLPDFYDTDYEENGEDHGLSYFSIMSSGSYNNDGRTPPYYNAEERMCLGWMMESDLQELPEGPVSFGSVKDDIAYITRTNTEGEYFLYECRDGSGWDAPLRPGGLTIYHVDKSTVRSVGGLTPRDQWLKWSRYNSINAYGDHPCFYIIPSSDQTNLNYSGTSLSTWYFPGFSHATEFIPMDWEGMAGNVMLSSISYADGKVSLTTHYSSDNYLYGKVKDSDGQGIEGVKVILSKKSDPASAPRPFSVMALVQAPETYTDADGSFKLIFNDFDAAEGRVSFVKEGYQPVGVDVTLDRQAVPVNVTMLKVGEGERKDFSYYDTGGGLRIAGLPGEGTSQMASIRIPASDLDPAGGIVKAITFWPYSKAKAYYFIVDDGEERIFTGQLTDDFNAGSNDQRRVSLTSMNIRFSGKNDLHIGYAVKDAVPIYADYPDYLFIIGYGSNTYYSPFDLNSSHWTSPGEERNHGLVLTATLSLGDDIEEITNFGQMGFSSIADPGKGIYADGDSFQLITELPEGLSATSVTWTFDGKDVTGAKSVQLKSGKHTVTAVITYADGGSETLDLALTVK